MPSRGVAGRTRTGRDGPAGGTGLGRPDVGRHEQGEQRRVEESRTRRKRVYDATQGISLPIDYLASRHVPPGTVTWGVGVAMGRFEDKVQVGENRRIEAMRDQDLREEEEAKQQARRKLWGVLAGAGTLVTAAALSPSGQRMIRKALGG